jgi:hypothetical protein
VTDDGTCRFAAIDVDEYSLDLPAVDARVKGTGLPLVVCRTKSGGAHLYVFFSENAPADRVRKLMSDWAAALGWPRSEIFPKQSAIASEDDVGSWINMPYFGGDASARYALREGAAVTCAEFLDIADSAATTIDAAELLEIGQDERLRDAPPCLQHLSVSGFPVGTRNKALFNLALLCRRKFGEGWTREVDECNRNYLRPPLPDSEVRTIVGSVEKKNYTYTCSEQPICDACNRSVCSKRLYGIGGSKSDPGVSLDGLTKILTSPPTWTVNVNGRRLTLESTTDLLDQGRFVTLCVDGLSVLPNRVQRQVWDDVVRTLLEKVDEVEAPEDAGTGGQFLALVERFCTEGAFAKDRSELTLGKVLRHESKVFFRSSDLIAYMDRNRVRVSAREAWRLLKEFRDVEALRFRVKDKRIWCWGVSVSAAEPPEQEHGGQERPEQGSEVPRIDGPGEKF